MSPKPTEQELKLYNALLKAGIKCDLGVDDGDKTIDISIDWAQLDIEVDGLQHYIDPKQIMSDLDRMAYSHDDEYDTLHVPNFVVDNHLDQLVKAIAEVARRRYRDMN